MKKVLLIATGLMAINLPVNAAQVNQVSNADQVSVGQQLEQIQTDTNARCYRWPGGWYCF